MPNWVQNSMAVTATSAERLADFLQAVSTPPADAASAADPAIGDDALSPHGEAFSFETLIPMPAQPGESDWYNWRVENWGTKWDACEASVEVDTSGLSAVLRFDTAWSPPEPVFEAVHERFVAGENPALTNIDIRFEEEQGWGGRMFGDADGLVLTEEWDIPQCHADYDDRGDDCICYDSFDCRFSDCVASRVVEDGVTELLRAWVMALEETDMQSGDNKYASFEDLVDAAQLFNQASS